jgi:hypothetical protein
MMTNRYGHLFALAAAATMLAACGSAPMQNGAVVPQGASSQSRVRPQHRSWMDLGLAKQDLLYVSNGNSEVTVYRYWQHTLVGVLTQFTQPKGECADSAGNVYITDSTAQRILEFAHGGTKPIKSFDDSPDSPYTCSIDPTTGNLAVANQDGTSQPGSIAIWKKGSSSPTRYTDSLLYYFEGCAYDANGNLLVTNGSRYPYGTYFAWLSKAGNKLINITVPGPDPSRAWGYVQGIQWDGKYFAIDDYYIYRIALIHGQAYYVGETELDAAGSNGPYWIYNNKPGTQGTQVVGGVNGDEDSVVNYWHYPSGGEPIFGLSHGIDNPFGVTVSLKQQK